MVSAFYGDMLLYLPALGNIAGMGMGLSYRLFAVLIHLLTLFSAYYCFSGIFGRKSGLTGAVTYAFLLYRFVDMYERGAVGEYCAIAFRSWPMRSTHFSKMNTSNRWCSL